MESNDKEATLTPKYSSIELRRALDDDLEVQEFIDQNPVHEFSLKKLSHRHRFIIHLASLGLSQKEICARGSYTPTYVSGMMNYEPIRKEIDKLRLKLFDDSPEQMLRLSAPKAVQVIADTLNNEQLKTNLRVDTAFRALDRVFGKPTQKIEQTGGSLRDLFSKLDQIQHKLDADIVPSEVMSPSHDLVSDAEIIDTGLKETSSDEEDDKMERFLEEKLGK